MNGQYVYFTAIDFSAEISGPNPRITDGMVTAINH
jgi:hypothetical protein